jgi:hypothetical protein
VSTDDKPPWEAKDKRDRQWMETWVNEKLDGISWERAVAMMRSAVERRDQNRKCVEELMACPQWHIDQAIAAAEHGDPEPLRRLLKRIDPRLERYIHLPKLKRGEHFNKIPVVDENAPCRRLQGALRELPRIKAIWKEHYGKTNRQDGQLRATEIAANRWRLTEDEVINKRLSRDRS